MIIRIIDGILYVRQRLETDPTGYALRNLFKEIQWSPNITVFCMDLPGNNAARRELYPEYKAKRKPPTDDISALLELSRKVIGFSKAILCQIPGFEADDAIAHLAARYSRAGHPVQVVSTDADLRQLEQLPGVQVTANNLKAIPPGLIRLYKAAVGDPSDNIPGIAGLGKKAFEECDHDSLAAWFEDRGGIPTDLPARVQNAMAANADLYRTFYKIVAFLPLEDDFVTKHMVLGKNDEAAAMKLLAEYLQ
jgi:5'-3' exonuclease